MTIRPSRNATENLSRSLGLYVLDGHTPRRVENVAEWAREYERALNTRQVGLTDIGGAKISTVFTGIDYNAMFHERPPALFETMIFGGPLDGRQWRYSAWDEAEKGHESAVQEAKNAVAKTYPVKDQSHE